VHSSLLAELAYERMDNRRREAEVHAAAVEARSIGARSTGTPWRVVIGVRLIGWGCRLWLSGQRPGPDYPPPPAARFVPPTREAS
jgi:hypothetical protein